MRPVGQRIKSVEFLVTPYSLAVITNVETLLNGSPPTKVIVLILNEAKVTVYDYMKEGKVATFIYPTSGFPVLNTGCSGYFIHQDLILPNDCGWRVLHFEFELT
jgi:hypothetical protein